MSECRTALMRAMSDIKARYENENIAILLSGGVDTAAAKEANGELGDSKIIIQNAVTVLTSESATDRPYASPVAIRHSLSHHILDVNLLAVLEMLPFCVKTLRTFDGMTLRNSIVIALALKKAKELGASVILTGDGADELMGGYSFTWATVDDTLWVTKRNELAGKMNFSTGEMASALGLKAVASPFLEPVFIDWATTSTSRADCIGDMPIELSPSMERIMHITGKVCLRNAFPLSPSAHRKKDPIEVGSGASALNVSQGGAEFFGAQLNMPQTPEGLEAFAYEKRTILEDHGVAIKDVEHLYYYREFLRCFPPTSDDLMKAGENINIERFTVDACVGCGYRLRKCDDMF